MTDPRVTPQADAVEAAAKVMYADAGGILEGRWQYRAAEAERILAAAVPLLCQPLQDEIDRLRAALEHSNRILDEYLRLGPIDVLAAALAAVPVGTG